jgi:hypothetical protein
MIKFSTEWKNEIHVPNHQPVVYVAFATLLEGFVWN